MRIVNETVLAPTNYISNYNNKYIFYFNIKLRKRAN